MNPPWPALDVDLLIEHDGHQVGVTGSGRHFVAKFPTLFSLLHFSWAFWSVRKHVPREFQFQVELRDFRFALPVKRSGRSSV